MLTSIDIGHVKPSAQAYTAALDRLGVRAEEAIFVGHDQDELDGALQCGLTTVAFNHEKDIVADRCARHFLELLSIIA